MYPGAPNRRGGRESRGTVPLRNATPAAADRGSLSALPGFTAERPLLTRRMAASEAVGPGPRPGGTRSRGAEFLLLLLLATAASLWMGFRPVISPISPGRDNSWIYAFHHATLHHLQWGREFVSTFGPYGYLLFTVDVDGFVPRRLAADLALTALTGIAAAVYVETALPTARLVGRIGLTLFLTYALAMHFTEYRWFGLLVLVALIGLHRPGWPGLAAHAAAGLLAGFSVLIKFSIGF